LGQSGGVVDAVADHGHHLARALEPADLGCFAVGQDVGQYPVDAYGGGYVGRGALVIPAQQDRAQPEGAQLGHCLSACWLDPVS
jgi:hypothetical protein